MYLTKRIYITAYICADSIDHDKFVHKRTKQVTDLSCNDDISSCSSKKGCNDDANMYGLGLAHGSKDSDNTVKSTLKDDQVSKGKILLMIINFI